MKLLAKQILLAITLFMCAAEFFTKISCTAQLLPLNQVNQIIRDRFGIFRKPALNRLNETVQPSELFKNLLRDITFKYYNSEAEVIYSTPIRDNSEPEEHGCDPTGKFSIIVHGYNESCSREWVTDLVTNLHKHRGGCVICMDYGPFASMRNYLRLLANFNGIVRVLVTMFERMARKGFSADNGFLFGFSFGAQVVLRGARRYGNKVFKEIVACDPAGPGFDLVQLAVDFKNSAQNVECIHTSTNLGSALTTFCHQDWRMGECGVTQDAADDKEFRSHGLCPLFYNSAFTHDFVAVEKPDQCKATQSAAGWPENFKMGYLEQRKWMVVGELFAETTHDYPYSDRNVTAKDMKRRAYFTDNFDEDAHQP